MKQYSCVIIDDEPLARKVIKEYIEALEELNLEAEFKDALSFRNAYPDAWPDIIFLDINMPKLSGVEFVKSFEPDTHIVFTTAYHEFALEAFELNATDYLVKPVSFNRFIKTIEKIKSLDTASMGSDKSWITVKENKRLYKINHQDIYYFQAYGDYVKIICDNKNHITKSKLSDILKLNIHQFIQVHRSYIVNLEKIEFLEGNHISIQGEKIPVSSSYKEELISRLG